MLIASWNVNSVRARIENILTYIKETNPDILMLQEIKTEEKNFPKEAFKEIGYNSFIFGQKSYNGVAFLTKVKINNVSLDFIKDPKKQSRIITGEVNLKVKKIKLINIYVPNGNPVDSEKFDYKIKWLDMFIKNIKNIIKKKESIIISGDFNIIPEEIDCYNAKKFENDALFKIEIRKKYRELINLGLNDVFRHFYKNKIEYTYWDYFAGSWQKNNGLRIDHFLVTSNLIENLKKININKKPRSKQKPSDHTPVELEIN
tara:strand:- start:509 stop:1285 length:777 start_codon:yes stop_codon:yes gene_type:complete